MKEGGGKSIPVPWPEGRELEIYSALQERHQVPCQQIQLFHCSSSLRPRAADTLRVGTQDPSVCRAPAAMLLSPHPSPPLHSPLKSLPFHDRLDTHFGRLPPFQYWCLGPVACVSFPELPQTLATRPQGPGHARQPQPLKVRLFPQHQQQRTQ